MPQFGPFAGIRYATEALEEVTAPPYDVIDAEERAGLCARHEHNVVRIDMPVAEDGPDPYEAAARRFARWQAEGVLLVDSPALYPYRMTATDETGAVRRTLGVLGALAIDPVGRVDVLPHEHTTPKAHSDRLALLEATKANLSAIWGLSLAGGLTALVDTDAATPLGAWHDEDGVGHELWRLEDPAAVEAVCEAVGSAPLVIADGHHRYSTCLKYADSPAAPAGAAATMCLVVELEHEQLTVQPIHRLLTGLPEGSDLPALLAADFAVGELEALPSPEVVNRLVAERSLALLTADGLRLLTPLRENGPGVVEPLDSVRVAQAAEALPPHELTYQHGVGHVLAAVRSGRAQAAILLRPVSVDQIRATAEARGLMPPKSTFFYPKPRTGTVFRSLS
ncbi:MAG: DUF1015 family protein [Sporichthyaceae bacterium]